MNDRDERDGQVETLVRKALEVETGPELSPFFAARVANIAKAEQKRHHRRTHPLLSVYWFLLLATTIVLLVGQARSELAHYALLALVPIGFAAALFWRRLLDMLNGLLVLLFGRQASQGQR
jgi:hypothetical protein